MSVLGMVGRAGMRGFVKTHLVEGEWEGGFCFVITLIGTYSCRTW